MHCMSIFMTYCVLLLVTLFWQSLHVEFVVELLLFWSSCLYYVDQVQFTAGVLEIGASALLRAEQAGRINMFVAMMKRMRSMLTNGNANIQLNLLSLHATALYQSASWYANV